MLSMSAICVLVRTENGTMDAMIEPFTPFRVLIKGYGFALNSNRLMCLSINLLICRTPAKPNKAQAVHV